MQISINYINKIDVNILNKLDKIQKIFYYLFPYLKLNSFINYLFPPIPHL